MLKISNIVLGYNKQKVVDISGFELADNNDLLLTGVSGSGKTTLLYALAGIIKPLQGNITINGTDITLLNEAQRDRFRGQKIGIIFQTLHLVKHLNILDNLLLASYLSANRTDKDYAVSILESLGIGDKKHCLPQQLSQGQSQRVAIARAVLNKPELILADEPTSSLDDESCESVIALLKNAAKESGATLILSTHDSRVKQHFTNIIKLGK